MFKNIKFDLIKNELVQQEQKIIMYWKKENINHNLKSKNIKVKVDDYEKISLYNINFVISDMGINKILNSTFNMS